MYDSSAGTLVKLIDKISELRKKEETKLVSYMVVAVRNNAYNFLRSQKKPSQVSFEEYIGQENLENADRQIESRIIAREDIPTLKDMAYGEYMECGDKPASKQVFFDTMICWSSIFRAQNLCCRNSFIPKSF